MSYGFTFQTWCRSEHPGEDSASCWRNTKKSSGKHYLYTIWNEHSAARAYLDQWLRLSLCHRIARTSSGCWSQSTLAVQISIVVAVATPGSLGETTAQLRTHGLHVFKRFVRNWRFHCNVTVVLEVEELILEQFWRFTRNTWLYCKRRCWDSMNIMIPMKNRFSNVRCFLQSSIHDNVGSLFSFSFRPERAN